MSLPVLELDVGPARIYGRDGGNRSLHSRYTAHRRYATHTAHTTYITRTDGTACAAGTAFTTRAAHAARADHRAVHIIYLTSTAYTAHATPAASTTIARVHVLLFEMFARLPLPPPLLPVASPLRLRYNDSQPPPSLPRKARARVGHG